MSSGAARGPSTQAATAARSSGPRTVTAVEPEAAGDAARSVGGKRTVSSGRAVRAEVVHLGAVGLVVVDDHDHRQARAGRRSPARRAPISAPPSPSAATGSRSGRASAAPIAVARPSPIGLERLGEAEPELVRHARNMLG